MANESLKLEGLKELEDAIKELPKATGRNVIRRALTRAAAPMAAAASAIAPKGKTGRLKQSIVVSKVRFTKGDAGKAAFAAAMKRGASRTEAAQAAHEANAAAGGDLDITSGLVELGPTLAAWYAHFVEFGTVKMSAKPFMRPAWEGGKISAAESIHDLLKQEIQLAAERAARKAAREIAKVKGLR